MTDGRIHDASTNLLGWDVLFHPGMGVPSERTDWTGVDIHSTRTNEHCQLGDVAINLSKEVDRMRFIDTEPDLQGLIVDGVVRRYGVRPEAARRFLEEFTEYDVTKIMVAKPLSEEYEMYHLQMIWGRDYIFERMMEEAEYDAGIDREEQLQNRFDQRDHYNGE